MTAIGSDLSPRYESRRALFLCFIFAILFFVPLHAQGEDVYDPFESFNRKVFWFNDRADIYLFTPIAKGYRGLTSPPVRRAISSFFDNLKYPVRLTSDLLQLKGSQAALHTSRFLINSTVGFLGFFDAAKHFGLANHYEDIGTALGYRGVPEGPYLVVPIFGPMNARDATGRLFDYMLDLKYAITFTQEPISVKWSVTTGVAALESVNFRTDLLKTVETAKSASLDYYMFVRSWYHQMRQNLIYDGSPPDADAEFRDDLFPDEWETRDKSDSSLATKAESGG